MSSRSLNGSECPSFLRPQQPGRLRPRRGTDGSCLIGFQNAARWDGAPGAFQLSFCTALVSIKKLENPAGINPELGSTCSRPGHTWTPPSAQHLGDPKVCSCTLFISFLQDPSEIGSACAMWMRKASSDWEGPGQGYPEKKWLREGFDPSLSGS